MTTIARILLVVPLCAAAGLAAADTWQVDPDDSIFSVVIRKDGFASGLAHDHLISLENASPALTGASLDDLAFELAFPVTSLVPDAPELKAQHEARLVELGLLDEPFTDLKERQRGRVRKHMLDDDQLDAAQFPQITARLVSIESRDDDRYRVALSLDIHGVTLERTVDASVALTDARLEVEAHGPLLFSDFGIKPYSAMLGAVRNQDQFFLYVKFAADRTAKEK